MLNPSEIDFLKSCIRNVPDFPTPGILFKDVTPLLANPKARTMVSDGMVSHYKGQNIQAVASIEARGFLFGMMLAQELKVPFIPIRKSGKLPYKKITADYDLEYGKSSIEIHSDAFIQDAKVLIHDDLLATGGTANAAAKLVQQAGAKLVGFSFVINLKFLSGEVNLNREYGVEVHSLLNFFE